MQTGNLEFGYESIDKPFTLHAHKWKNDPKHLWS